MFDITPANTTVAVKSVGFTFDRSLFKVASKSPLFSATPTPSIATRTVPNGAKPVKFSVAELKM